MNYVFIRIGVIIFISLICCALYFVFKIKKFSVLRIIALVAIICSLVVYFAPFENLFFRFKTPQDAFFYTNSGRIVNTLSYRNNTAIIYEVNNDMPYFMIIPKDSKGWLITNPTISLGTPFVTVDNSTIVYKHLNSDDLFVRISCTITNSKIPVISDSNNTKFEKFDMNAAKGGVIQYYAFTQYKEGYYITIDGINIVIK